MITHPPPTDNILLLTPAVDQEGSEGKYVVSHISLFCSIIKRILVFAHTQLLSKQR